MASFAGADESLTAELREILVGKARDCVPLLLANTTNDEVNGDGLPWHLDFEKAELNLKVFSSLATGSAIKRFKAVCIVKDTTPKEVIDFIGDTRHRLTWDRNIADLSVLPLSDDGKELISLLRSCTKQVGPISGRDFIDSTIVKTLEDGSIINGGWGIDVPELGGLHPPTKKFVRGLNQAGTGWHLQVSGSDTRVVYCIQTDLRGWFLPVVINAAIGGSYVAFFEDMTRALNARKQGGK
jgi:hypothetical protein